MKGIFILASILAIGLSNSTPSATNQPNANPNPLYPSLNCDNVVLDAGADDTICSPGETVGVNATATGDIISVSWEPAALFDDPTSLSTSVTLNNTTTLTCTVLGISSTNLVNNGDFSINDISTFTSEYIPGTGGPNGLLDNEGQYAIASNSNDMHQNWASCTDHTGGGNMLAVNASLDPDDIWCQNITVAQNTDYAFSTWVTSVFPTNPAQLQFTINDNTIGETLMATPTTCEWNQFYAIWNSGNETSATICIANVNTELSGNDFAIDDISFSEVCVSTDSLVISLAELDATWASPGELCADEGTITLDDLLDANATPGGTWTIDGVTSTVLDPAQLTIGMHDIEYAVSQDICTESSLQSIQINAAPNSGASGMPEQRCEGTTEIFSLADLLLNADSGGTWTETSVNPSTGNAFDESTGTFNTDAQVAGTYSFDYTVSGTGGCADATTSVLVILTDAPVADAGDGIDLNCDITEVTLGGSGTSTGPEFEYNWEALNGSPITGSDTPFPDVDQPDIYTLTVTNQNSGCVATDQIEVVSNITDISATAIPTDPLCGQPNTGGIIVTSVTGGAEPYEYALDGGVFTGLPQFGGLSGGTYTITVMDANGCETTVDATINQANELSVALNANVPNQPPVISLGDSVQIDVLVNVPDSSLSSIVWKPEIPGCDNCTSIIVSPSETTNFVVTVTDAGGCSNTAELTILVERNSQIFIPNAFSPNGDGINDMFYINAGSDIQIIRTFRILDRWGNLIFEDLDFAPNDPTRGWDGKIRGKRSNSGVFVYFAEIELKDGDTIIEKGSVSLVY